MLRNKVFEQMAKQGIRTRKALAEKVGLTEPNIGKIVSGDIKGIRLDTLEALCRVLNCQPNELFEYVAGEEGGKARRRGKGKETF